MYGGFDTRKSNFLSQFVKGSPVKVPSSLSVRQEIKMRLSKHSRTAFSWESDTAFGFASIAVAVNCEFNKVNIVSQKYINNKNIPLGGCLIEQGLWPQCHSLFPGNSLVLPG